MKATTQAEGRPYYLNWELQKAAEKLLREIMMVKPGETVLITCDTTNDERVINATAGAALTMGAYPIVMQYPASLEQAIMIEPTKPVLEAIKAGTAAKGDVLGVARVAGIMAAKRTWELIPLCHPLMLTHLSVDFEILEEACAVHAVCTARLTGKTGVEMEALTGVSAALLTIYDMCKAMDRSMELTDIRLVHKEGGKSGVYDREQ